MTFKEQAARDLTGFFNIDEFADTHTVNGKTMPAIIDDNNLVEHADSDVLGIWGESTTIYVKSEEYGDIPKKGATINVDGITWRVTGATSESGVYAIATERIRANGSRIHKF